MGRSERDQLDLFGAVASGDRAPEEAPGSARSGRQGRTRSRAATGGAGVAPAGKGGGRVARSGAGELPLAGPLGDAPSEAAVGEEVGASERPTAAGPEDLRTPGSIAPAPPVAARGRGLRSAPIADGGERTASLAAEAPGTARPGTDTGPIAPAESADPGPARPGGGERGGWLRAAIQSRLAGGEPPAPPSQTPAAPRVLTVSELARQVKGTLESRFAVVHVRGEISNLRQPGSGHVYFSLKDDAACIRAVLFRSQARLLRFRPQNGQEVIVRGRVNFYEAGGDTQIVCDTLEPVGAGALAVAFEQLKARLAAEGLFDPARKRPIPYLPRKIGVVTSPTGAAIRDFLRVLQRRFPRMQVLVAPARVQGEGAAEEIAAAIRRLSDRGDCDVIVATRGGGSIEDLWAFNEEVVARAIAASRVPVVSAVGHEIDFTIADFVADARAATPTAAAEMLAPVETELRASIAVARSRLERALAAGLDRRRAAVVRLQARMGDPRRRLASERLALDDRLRRAAEAQRRLLARRREELERRIQALRRSHPAARMKAQARLLAGLRERLHAAMRTRLAARAVALRLLRDRLHQRNPRERVLREARRLGERWARLESLQQRSLERRRARVAELAQRLQALSPLRVLARGYAIAFRASGAVLLSASEARPGERLHLELADGALAVEVVGPAPSRKEGARPARGTNGPFDPAEGGR